MAKTILPKPAVIMTKALKARQKNNPAVSIRWLARRVGVSHPFLVQILKGKKSLPLARFKKLSAALDMDETTQEILRRSILKNMADKSVETSSVAKNLIEEADKNRSINEVANYTSVFQKDFENIHDTWYNLAILDLVTCSNFSESPAWIAKKLTIKEREAKLALMFLIEKGYLLNVDGKLKKVENKIRFSTTKSQASIRKYHTYMAQRAIQELQKTDQESFERRLIMGTSFAANPANLAKAKERLVSALIEVAEILAEGDCTEIYHLNGHLLPLTK